MAMNGNADTVNRPPVGQWPQVMMRVPPDVAEQLRATARKTGRSVGSLTYALVESAMSRQERADICTLDERMVRVEKALDYLIRIVTSAQGIAAQDAELDAELRKAGVPEA